MSKHHEPVDAANDESRPTPPGGSGSSLARLPSAEDQSHRIELKDVAEIIIGAGALALPVSMSSDTWEIASRLHSGKIIAIALASVFFIAFFVYAAYFRGRLVEHLPHFVLRVFAIYGLTAIVACATLVAVDQAPWLSNPVIALKQTVLVALPTSFAATIIDNLT